MQWSSLLLVNSIVIVTGSETSHWRPVPNARVCLHEEVLVDVPVQSFVKVPLGSDGAGAGVGGDGGSVEQLHQVQYQDSSLTL